MNFEPTLIAAIAGGIVTVIVGVVPVIIKYRQAMSKLKAEEAARDLKQNKELGEIRLHFQKQVEDLRLAQARSERESELQKALIGQLSNYKELSTELQEMTSAVKRVGDEQAFQGEQAKQSNRINDALRSALDRNTEATLGLPTYFQEVVTNFNGMRGDVQGVKQQVESTGNEVKTNSDERAKEIMEKLTEIETSLHHLEEEVKELKDVIKPAPITIGQASPALLVSAVQPIEKKAEPPEEGHPPKEKPSDNSIPNHSG